MPGKSKKNSRRGTLPKATALAPPIALALAPAPPARIPYQKCRAINGVNIKGFDINYFITNYAKIYALYTSDFNIPINIILEQINTKINALPPNTIILRITLCNIIQFMDININRSLVSQNTFYDLIAKIRDKIDSVEYLFLEALLNKMVDVNDNELCTTDIPYHHSITVNDNELDTVDIQYNYDINVSNNVVMLTIYERDNFYKFKEAIIQRIMPLTFNEKDNVIHICSISNDNEFIPEYNRFIDTISENINLRIILLRVLENIIKDNATLCSLLIKDDNSVIDLNDFNDFFKYKKDIHDIFYIYVTDQQVIQWYKTTLHNYINQTVNYKKKYITLLQRGSIDIRKKLKQILQYIIIEYTHDSSILPIEDNILLGIYDAGLEETDGDNFYRYKVEIIKELTSKETFMHELNQSKYIYFKTILFTSLLQQNDINKFKMVYTKFIKSLHLKNSRYLKRILDNIITKHEFNLNDLLQTLLTLIKTSQHVDNVLPELYKFIKNFPNNNIKITLPLTDNGFYDIILKLNNNKQKDFDMVRYKLYTDIKNGIKEKLYSLDAKKWINRHNNLLDTFSIQYNSQFQIEHIRKLNQIPIADIVKISAIQKTSGFVKLPLKYSSGSITTNDICNIFTNYVSIIPDISPYLYPQEKTYYINFRTYSLTKEETEREFPFDRNLLSNKSYTVPYIMGRIIPNRKITYWYNAGFIETIKIKLNKDPSAKLLLLLYENVICDPLIYELLCDLVYSVSYNQINIICDYTPFIINGKIENGIKLKCKVQHVPLVCNAGITYLSNPNTVYISGLHKIMTILEGLKTLDKSKIRFINYLILITRYKNVETQTFAHTAMKGRLLFITNYGSLDQPNKKLNEEEDRYIATLIDYGFVTKNRIKYLRKMDELAGIKDGDVAGYSVIMGIIIKDIITLYNRMIINAGNDITEIVPETVKPGMRMNIIMSAIEKYILDVSTQWKR